MSFKHRNAISNFLFLLCHDSPFQFITNLIRKHREERVRAGQRECADGCGSCCNAACHRGDIEQPAHDDDRLIAGCDYVAVCERSGRWIELGGEG